jgi:transposase-like protein
MVKRRTGSGQRIAIKESEWQRVFAEFAKSGLTVSRFCRERGIAKSGFYAWRNKLAPQSVKRTNAKPVVEFTEVEITNTKLSCEIESSAPITIHLDDACRLEVPSGFDPESLRNIIRVLRGAAC